MSKAMLTTVDNPFSPFTEHNQWLGFDRYLARVNDTQPTYQMLATLANTSPYMDPRIYEGITYDAMARLVRLDPTNRLYIIFEDGEIDGHDDELNNFEIEI